MHLNRRILPVFAAANFFSRKNIVIVMLKRKIPRKKLHEFTIKYQGRFYHIGERGNHLGRENLRGG